MELFDIPTILAEAAQAVPVITQVLIDVGINLEVHVDTKHSVLDRDPDPKFYHQASKLFHELSVVEKYRNEKKKNPSVAHCLEIEKPMARVLVIRR